MGAYEKFAQVYDLFMDNIDYEEWADYITGHLREYGIEDGLVLELGCGTGTMTGNQVPAHGKTVSVVRRCP